MPSLLRLRHQDRPAETTPSPAHDRAATIDRNTPVDQLPEWLRVDEVAAHLDVSRGLVFELCRRGELRSAKFGRLLRIPKEALVALRSDLMDPGGR